MMMLNVKTLYDIIYEAINEQYENGDITFEQANELNELAYDKYIIETSKATKEKRDRLYYGINGDKVDKKAPIINSKSNFKYDRSNEYDNEKKFRSELKYPNPFRLPNYGDEKKIHKNLVRDIKRRDDYDSDYYWNRDKDYKTGKEQPALEVEHEPGYKVIRYKTKTPQLNVNPKRTDIMNKLAKKREYNNDAEYEKRRGYFGDIPSRSALNMQFHYDKPNEEEKAAREERKEALRNLDDTKPKSMLKKKK